MPPDTAPIALPEAIPATSATVPTLADVSGLLADADYSRFIAADVDRVVHHAAMKKLFAEPGFSVMDELDIYIADYNIASPVSAVMLAGFAHASTTLNPTAAWQSATDLPPPAVMPGKESAGRAEAGVVPSDGTRTPTSDNDMSTAAVTESVTAAVTKPDKAMVCSNAFPESALEMRDHLP